MQARLDPHRHDDRDVVVLVVGGGAQHGRIELAAQSDGDFVLALHGVEHIEQIARVEANADFRSVIIDRNLIETVAALGAFTRNSQSVFRNAEFDATSSIARR